MDLSKLRVCITGGEVVHAETLRTFTERFAAASLSTGAICPAYGLAEAGLAVTMSSTQTPWRSIHRKLRVDDTATGICGTRSVELVSAGKPLAGYKILTDTGDEPGVLRICGPSICDSYIGQYDLAQDRDGWLVTTDLAIIDDDELFPIGRNDDVFLIHGRNIYAIDVEVGLDKLSGIRSGRVAAVSGPEGELVVVAELDSATEIDTAARQRLRSTIRSTLAKRVGVAPSRVVFVGRGSLPMTASGKVRRKALTSALHTGSLPSTDDY